LWLVVAKNFGNSAWIFQEDNALCHVSKQRNAWKADNNIPNFPWPAQTPDINVITIDRNDCSNTIVRNTAPEHSRDRSLLLPVAHYSCAFRVYTFIASTEKNGHTRSPKTVLDVQGKQKANIRGSYK
jgi:hypothetical protein